MLWQNDQVQPVGAIDLPCEKPPTPTRLEPLVRRLRPRLLLELTATRRIGMSVSQAI